MVLWLAAAWLALILAIPNAHAAERRLRIVMVLDASGSMAQNDPQRLVRVASKMLSDLADERDHVTVISFGSEIHTLGASRGDEHEALRRAIETLGQNESCTDYLRALEAAANAFNGAADPSERRLVLFLTDGRFEPARPNGSCGRFEGAPVREREPLEQRAKEAARRLKRDGARLFTIGLGNAPSRAAASKALLEEVAQIAGGRFLHARGPRDVPRIFASIFGGIVGAPVMQDALEQGRQSVELEVPGGANRAHVVLVPARAVDLDGLEVSRDGAPVHLEPVRKETATSAYRLARVTGEASGIYRISGSPAGRVEVLIVPDVGLSLRLENVPEVLAEGEPLKAKVALRTRTGRSVELAPSFLEHVRFTVELADAKLYDQRPNTAGVASFKSGVMKRGNYTLRASAEHAHGFLELEPAQRSFRVEPRFSMKLDLPTVRFDTMAEEGDIPLEEPAVVRVTAPDPLPVPMHFTLEVPEAYADVLVVEPAGIVFDVEGERSATLSFRWVDPEALRGRDIRFDEPLELVPREDQQKLLVGETAWEIPVEGALRAWGWRRYLQEYKWKLSGVILALLLFIYVIGRMVARRFPPKARIHYREVGLEFTSDSLIKRHAKHGAFRSAKLKFPLGKKSRPLVWLQSTGAGFQVIPAEGKLVTIVDDTVADHDRERRKPFRGQWEQRYRLEDRYEVWLTRR